MAKKVKKKNGNGNIKARCIALLKKGVGPTEVARKVGCSLTTARYHAKRIKEPFTKGQIKKMARNVREGLDNSPSAKLVNKMADLEHSLNEAMAARDEYSETVDQLRAENAKLKMKIEVMKEVYTDR